MNVEELKRVLSTFSDRPEDVDLSRDEVLIQVQDTLIPFRTAQRHGQIYIIEDGHESTAEDWIASRLANLPLLAARILDYVEETDGFVTPKGMAIEKIETNPEGLEASVEDVVQYTTGSLGTQSGISTFVLYLTSDAGEGKTTIINQMARAQAQAYLKKRTDWLLLPIPLGGRPFLRLDDIVVGSIVNRYRFRGLYYESFLELVKYGFIVPALDGFEEMFVVGSTGEAVSSLGNLIERLGSSGRLLVAARKAYFEIRDFESQARLFDGMQRTSASFARVKIERWQKPQFVDYWAKRSLSGGVEVYECLLRKLGNDETHPILSRAVIVRKLADIAQDQSRFESLMTAIDGQSATYFTSIVDSILEREITTKWMDRTGDGVRRPLITLEQHHQLLSTIAIEMAEESTARIGHGNLQLVTELFCDAQGLSPDVSRQVLNRIYDHPLLVKPEKSARLYSFDHDEFREYFLGVGVGNLVMDQRETDVRSVFRKTVLTDNAVDACRGVLKTRQTDYLTLFNFLQDLTRTESLASYARENCGRLLVKVIQDGNLKGVVIRETTFPDNVFVEQQFDEVEFRKCFFQSASLSHATLRNCRFVGCEFEAFEIDEGNRITDCSMVDCTIFSLLLKGWDAPVFGPGDIQRNLVAAGFRLETELRSGEGVQEPTPQDEDERLILLTRAMRSFHRATAISDNVFQIRLGKKAGEFIDSILPEALQAGVFREEPYQGSGQHRRFRLGVAMSAIDDALRLSKGNYGDFLHRVADRSRISVKP